MVVGRPDCSIDYGSNRCERGIGWTEGKNLLLVGPSRANNRAVSSGKSARSLPDLLLDPTADLALARTDRRSRRGKASAYNQRKGARRLMVRFRACGCYPS